MKRSILPNRRYLGLAALLLFAACTQGELADGNGTSLPAGKYPLQIGNLTLSANVDGQSWDANHAPQTRVSENDDRDSSHWQDGDKIKVQIADGTPGTYTYQGGSLTVAEGDAPAYWASRANDQPIRAWHTSSGSGTVGLDNQADSLAYVLTAQTTANFNTQVSLSFNHALAKVRMTLQGGQAGKVTDVKIQTCTSCTLHEEDGTLTAGGTKDFIPMVKTTYEGKTCWEANVMPGHEIAKVKVNDKEISLTKSITPQAAKVNAITLTVIGKLTPDEPITITGNGEYIITGSGDQTITINGNPTVTLDGVTISNDNIPIRITGGSPTLIITGETTLTTTNENAAGIQLEGENTHVQIKGNGTLEITSGSYGAGIGSGQGGTCGNVHINGITAIIDSNMGAGIGGGECGHCGDIKIENASLTIDKPEGAAAIGCGVPASADVITKCGNIEIMNSDITANVTNYYAGRPAAVGCCGAYNAQAKGSCGNITITLKSGQDKESFLSKLTVDGSAEKVGLGADGNTQRGKVGTITWRQSDGTVLEETPARGK